MYQHICPQRFLKYALVHLLLLCIPEIEPILRWSRRTKKNSKSKEISPYIQQSRAAELFFNRNSNYPKNVKISRLKTIWQLQESCHDRGRCWYLSKVLWNIFVAHCPKSLRSWLVKSWQGVTLPGNSISIIKFLSCQRRRDERFPTIIRLFPISLFALLHFQDKYPPFWTLS